MWRICLWWLVSLLIRWLPLKVSYALARLAADAVYFGWRKGRICAQTAMYRALGEQADPQRADQLARQSFRNFAQYLVDFLRLPRLKPEQLKTRVVFQGWENVEEAWKEERGLLLIGLHLGHYDLAAAFVRKHYPLSVVAQTFSPARINRWVQGIRAKLGIKVIPKEKVWEIATLLRRKQAVGLLIDSPPENAAVTVNFLGAPCQVPAGPALLSLRTGARIITGGLVRQKGNQWVCFFDRCIQYCATGNLKEDVQQLTQHIMDSLEELVKKYPEQWYIFRSLWVTPTEAVGGNELPAFNTLA
jgi:KDO2-lipid IV(A) lauroyltransferase